MEHPERVADYLQHILDATQRAAGYRSVVTQDLPKLTVQIQSVLRSMPSDG